MSAEQNVGSSQDAEDLAESSNDPLGSIPDSNSTGPVEAAEVALATQREASEAHGVEESPQSSSGSAALDSVEARNMMAEFAATTVAQGQIIQGKVLKVTDEEVLVDIGLKCEGAIPRAEFLAEDGRLTVAPGDSVDVWVESYDEKEETVSLSRAKAARLKVWEEIERAFRDQTNLHGRVMERVKGGWRVDIGVSAFLPGSQGDVRPLYNLDALQGQEITCKVIKLNRKRSNVVVSRKMAMEEEAQERKARLLEHLKEGAVVTGRVKNLTQYGVFVDLGGMDGLLHITDLAWGRVQHPSEIVQVGQEIQVKVLKYDAEKGRVSLGLKQLQPDPWERVPQIYHPGDRVTGRVVSITDYGAFVELEPGVDGLMHISEMTWSKRLRHPSKIVNLNDRVEAAVLDVNVAHRRISLSLKQTLPDPWTSFAEKFTVGSLVQGKVRNLTDFGAFVEVQEGVDGLIHLSDISWTKKVRHPSEILKKGQKLQAVILNLDAAQKRLSLGLKQLQPDVWENFFSKVQVGSVVRGKVSRMASFGAFVELEEGIEGLCHISELGDGRAAGGRSRLEVGSELDFRIIRLSPEEKKIGLSLKGVEAPQSAFPAEKPKEKETLGTSTMAQALSSAGITPSDLQPSPQLSGQETSSEGGQNVAN